MEDSIKTTRIDVDKIDNIFDEILTFMLDTDLHDTQDDCVNRVKIADMIFKLAQSMVYRMMDINCNYRHEVNIDEFTENIVAYNEAYKQLSEMLKMTDILQG